MFIYSQIIFYIAIVFALFLPGYALLWAIFGKRNPSIIRQAHDGEQSRTTSSGHGILEPLEKFVFSFGLSVTILNFILFFIQKIGISISEISIVSSVSIFILVCLGIYLYRFHNKPARNATQSVADGEDNNVENPLFQFSLRQFTLILILILLTFIIKTTYLSNTVIPTATDMGHHMYWAKIMSETGNLPTYDGMPDFIIGEHTIFSVVNILSGASYFSAFPVILLYLVNILSLLAVFLLTLRVFGKKSIAILALFFISILYAVSSPQAKFVSGGVIGNVLGNYFIPVIFYFYFRAFSVKGRSASGEEFLLEKSRDAKTFLALAIFLNFGLFYTHHLSSFVFLFSFILIFALFLVVNYKELEIIFPKILKVLFSWQAISMMVLCLIFFFFIFTPTYISPSAVDTAVGSPVKSTRTGLSLEKVRSTVGDPRMALGLVGLVLLGIFYKKRNLGYSIVAAWTIMVFLMSTKPDWLFVDIPSNRIGNYLTYPIAILSAYGFYMILRNVKINNLVRASYFILIIFALTWGLREAGSSLKDVPTSSEIVQTFSASQYLAERSDETDKVLKDHNYLVGDAWIKLFFMRGYRYPLSRSYFKRYDDPTKPREMCTLYMISEPQSLNGKTCFSETGVNFLMVNPEFDSGQFIKNNNFDWVYASSELGIFYLPR